MFPHASLFRLEICDIPAALIELRNFLDRRGGILQQNTPHRVVMTSAHGLYEEAEDTQAAIEMAREIVAAGRRPRSSASCSNRMEEIQPGSQVTLPTSTKYTAAENVAHNVAMSVVQCAWQAANTLSDGQTKRRKTATETTTADGTRYGAFDTPFPFRWACGPR